MQNIDTGIILIDTVTAYNVFINSSSGHYINYLNISLDDNIDVPSFCSPTAMLSIFVSAVNIFGEGPISRPIMIGKLFV